MSETTKNASAKRLAIIDGKSVFYRGYYAMPNLATKDGTPTGGVYGFTVMALEVIKRLKPDYVCVAWDKPKTNIRKRLGLYPEYKAGRKPAPPDFYAQIPILHEVLSAFGWPLYELDDYEADDIMAGLSTKASKKGIQTFLITSDLDVLQLVGPLTHAYTLRTGLSNIVEFDEAAFKHKYGIDVHQFIDLKALKGDSSDNIPGVPGIGEKGALDLLREYKTLDGVYENVDLVKDSLAKKLKAGKESAYLSKELVTLMHDAPIDLDLEGMDITQFDRPKLEAILKRLEFRNIIRQIPDVTKAVDAAEERQGKSSSAAHTGKEPGANGRSAKAGAAGAAESKTAAANGEIPLFGSWAPPYIGCTVVAADKDLDLILLNHAKEIVVYCHDGTFDGKLARVMIFSPDTKTVYAVLLDSVSPTALAARLKEQLPDWVTILGYDIKTSLKVLRTLGIPRLPIGHDVQVGAFLINSLRRDLTLTQLAESDLDYGGMSLEGLDRDSLVAQAGNIGAIIRELAHKQRGQLKELPKVAKLAETIEWPVIPVLADMEYEGMLMDTNYLSKMSDELADSISDIEQDIYGHADQEFNISSPSQLADILFVKLALPTQGVKKGKTGYSTAADELAKLRGLHPIIDCITQYREFTKLKSTYVDALPKLVDEASRVHTTFNMTTAQTGRLSSLNPNLQNIPVRSELGKKIRTAFSAGKGRVLVGADYSQFELRIAAALSGDTGMVETFNRDADIHIETAAAVYGIKAEDVTKQQRYSAKAVNFGIMYGQGPHGLAAGTGMTFGEAKDFIAKYFEIRPKLKQYIEKLRKQAAEDGYVETLLGRRRPTPDVHSPNFVVREGAYRAAINMPVQGTAADLTKLAMVEVGKKLEAFNAGKPSGEQAMLLLQIHDSLMVECPAADAEAIGAMLKETMEAVYPKLGITLRVDVASGKTWGDI